MYSGDDLYSDDITSPTERPMPRLRHSGLVNPLARIQAPEADDGYDPHDDLDLAAHEALLADFAEQDESECSDCDPRARPLPMDGSDSHEYGEC